MAVKDFLLFVVLCFAWGMNIVVSRWVVADAGAPPLAFAALRFALVVVALAPFLRQVPKNLGLVFIIAMGTGTINFALLFWGLRTADAGATSVATQLGVPFMTILSVLFLGEQIGWRRIIGILMSFVGVLIIAFEPGNMIFSYGLFLVIGGVFVHSCASILMKKLPPIPAMQMQAWVALFACVPLFFMSLFTEHNQVDAFLHGGWMLIGGLFFGAFGVSVFAQGAFYVMLKKYDVTVVSPLTLMVPIWGVVLGVVLLGETLTGRMVIGSIISILGVGVIVVRPNTALPFAALGKKWMQ